MQTQEDITSPQSYFYNNLDGKQTNTYSFTNKCAKPIDVFVAMQSGAGSVNTSIRNDGWTKYYNQGAQGVNIIAQTTYKGETKSIFTLAGGLGNPVTMYDQQINYTVKVYKKITSKGCGFLWLCACYGWRDEWRSRWQNLNRVVGRPQQGKQAHFAITLKADETLTFSFMGNANTNASQNGVLAVSVFEATNVLGIQTPSTPTEPIAPILPSEPEPEPEAPDTPLVLSDEQKQLLCMQGDELTPYIEAIKAEQTEALTPEMELALQNQIIGFYQKVAQILHTQDTLSEFRAYDEAQWSKIQSYLESQGSQANMSKFDFIYQNLDLEANEQEIQDALTNITSFGAIILQIDAIQTHKQEAFTQEATLKEQGINEERLTQLQTTLESYANALSEATNSLASLHNQVAQFSQTLNALSESQALLAQKAQEYQATLDAYKAFDTKVNESLAKAEQAKPSPTQAIIDELKTELESHKSEYTQHTAIDTTLLEATNTTITRLEECINELQVILESKKPSDEDLALLCTNREEWDSYKAKVVGVSKISDNHTNSYVITEDMLIDIFSKFANSLKTNDVLSAYRTDDTIAEVLKEINYKMTPTADESIKQVSKFDMLFAGIGERGYAAISFSYIPEFQGEITQEQATELLETGVKGLENMILIYSTYPKYVQAQLEPYKSSLESSSTWKLYVNNFNPDDETFIRGYGDVYGYGSFMLVMYAGGSNASALTQEKLDEAIQTIIDEINAPAKPTFVNKLTGKTDDQLNSLATTIATNIANTLNSECDAEILNKLCQWAKVKVLMGVLPSDYESFVASVGFVSINESNYDKMLIGLGTLSKASVFKRVYQYLEEAFTLEPQRSYTEIFKAFMPDVESKLDGTNTEVYNAISLEDLWNKWLQGERVWVSTEAHINLMFAKERV